MHRGSQKSCRWPVIHCSTAVLLLSAPQIRPFALTKAPAYTLYIASEYPCPLLLHVSRVLPKTFIPPYSAHFQDLITSLSLHPRGFPWSSSSTYIACGVLSKLFLRSCDICAQHLSFPSCLSITRWPELICFPNPSPPVPGAWLDCGRCSVNVY